MFYIEILNMKGYKHYNTKEDNIIKKHYKTKSNIAIGKLLGRSADSVKHRMKKLELKRTPNQVKRLLKAPNAGHFKKGRIPHNTSKIGNGAIVERREKSGRIYKYIRTSLGVWELLQRVNYAKKHGPIPSGHVVIFLDGNSLNCELSNLKCITKAEHLKRNYRDLPEPIKQTKRLINKLSRAIQTQEKNG